MLRHQRGSDLRRQRRAGGRVRTVGGGRAALAGGLKPTADLAWLAGESDRIIGELVAPPPPAPGVYSTCRTWSDTGEDVCSNCADTRDALGAAALPINVATLYRKPSSLRDWLTGYKGDADGTQPPDPACLPPVRALAGRFLLEHGDTIAERAGGVDAVVVVPSTDRPPPHPLVAVLDSLHLDVPMVSCLVRTAGDLGSGARTWRAMP